ncbi:rhodanese-like domain-containing protein [Aquitalea sp. LB_tupeE]|uniref:rhodanese-like domain-containing protein n=1 Tax=Aquitalea sp. LB_tupeE TaxID=2748078 RepID=UPI0015C13D79|nr:rhodanese-like domain-containing protein [Aquitalea sp. LB_tupeE]NWK80001.1 rhodanese-like domain-containing protein [Aquitalea sp. LB_tupeE]
MTQLHTNTPQSITPNTNQAGPSGHQLSATDAVSASEELLEIARLRAADSGLAYTGALYPLEAWSLVEAGVATLVDVRTAEERKFVGQVPGSLHVAWQTGTALIKNPRFLRELENKAGGKNSIVVLLCRSGKRSAAAAEAAAKAGFTQVYNVLEGFEGDLDSQNQRGDVGGWRYWNLPWQQD